MRGSKPAARHARAIRPSVDAADQASSASSASVDRRRGPPARWSGASPTRNGSRSRSWRSRPSCSRRGERRVLEGDAEVQLAGPDALGQRLAVALLDQHLGVRARRGAAAARPRGRARPARWRTRRSAGARRRRELRQLRLGELQRGRRARRRARAGPCPARVSFSPPGSRSSSRAPTSFSSAATCWETAGWVSASVRAAALNERSWATARKVSTRRGSIGSAYRTAETII